MSLHALQNLRSPHRRPLRDWEGSRMWRHRHPAADLTSTMQTIPSIKGMQWQGAVSRTKQRLFGVGLGLFLCLVRSTQAGGSGPSTVVLDLVLGVGSLNLKAATWHSRPDILIPGSRRCQEPSSVLTRKPLVPSLPARRTILHTQRSMQSEPRTR